MFQYYYFQTLQYNKCRPLQTTKVWFWDYLGIARYAGFIVYIPSYF